MPCVGEGVQAQVGSEAGSGYVPVKGKADGHNDTAHCSWQVDQLAMDICGAAQLGSNLQVHLA